MMLDDRQKAGRIRVAVHGRSYSADWTVVGPRVFITSELGEGSVSLGGLASAPAAAAAEKLTEMAKAAARPKTSSRVDRSRFDVREAFRR